MSRIGVVGNGEDKFTPHQHIRVLQLIASLIQDDRFRSDSPHTVIVSGHSPLGGVDIWAENVADMLNVEKDIYAPVLRSWGKPDAKRGEKDYGYKARDLDIAKNSDTVHVIVAHKYPNNYTGRRFPICYHCKGRNGEHVKSGACWTAMQAERMGKPAVWHVID